MKFMFILFVIISANVVACKKKRIFFEPVKEDNAMDVADFSVYYNLETNKTIKSLMPRPWYKPGWILRLPFKGGPCECDGAQCICCTGIRVPKLNFDRQTCAILTYDPQESTIDMSVIMNNGSVYRDSFSTRNLPPFCVPIPVPYLPSDLFDMCVRLYDVSVVDQKLHVCMDMDTRIDKAPIVILHFDCMDMGIGGIGLSKPGGSQTNISPESTTTTQLDSDVYDPVTENYETTQKPIFINSMKYI